MTTLLSPAAPAKAARRLRDVHTLALTINGTAYGVEPIDAVEEGSRAFRLIKHSARECCYDVVRTHDGLVVCDCPDYVARHEGTVSMCKHGRALVALGLLDGPVEPAPAPTPEPTKPEPAPAPEPEPAAPEAPVPGEPAAPASAPDAAPVDELDRKRAESFGIKLPASSHTFTTPARRPFGEGLVEPEPGPSTCCPESESEPCVACAALVDAAEELLSLDGFIDHEADRYLASGTKAGRLIADALATLARAVRAVSAHTPDQYLDRTEALDASRRWEDQGEPDA